MASEHEEHTLAAETAWTRLYAAHAAVFKALERTLTSLGISAPQMMTLAFLAGSDGPVTPTRLADELALETQSVTGIIDRLETRGWARRVRDLRDRRMIRLELTPAGQAMLATTVAPTEAALNTVVGQLGVGEAATLTTLLQRLREQSQRESAQRGDPS